MKTRQKKISLAVKAAFIVPIGLAALTPNLGSANSFSSNQNNGSWSLAGTWLNTSISGGTTTTPGASSDTALIDRSGGGTVNVNVSRSISTVTVGTTNAGNRLNIGSSGTGPFTIAAGSGVTVGSGGSVYVGYLPATGGVLSTGSSVTNSGTIFTGNLGVVTIAGNLTNSGTYTSSGAGSLRVGSLTNNTGVLNNTGTATLVGAVNNGASGLVTNSGTLSTGAYTNAGSTTNTGTGIATINGALATTSGSTFTNQSGGSLTVTGTTTNSGVLINAGTGTLTGAVTNNNTLFNSGNLSSGAYTNSGSTNNTGTAVINGALANSGTFTSSNSLLVTTTTTNSGVLTNSGTATLTGAVGNGASGFVTNTGTLSTGAYTNAGGTTNTSGFTINGALANSGTLNNSTSGSLVVLGNTNISTAGQLTNNGTFNSLGALTNDGIVATNGKLTATSGYTNTSTAGTLIGASGEITTTGYLNQAGATTTINAGGKLNASGNITSGGNFTATGATVTTGGGTVAVTGGNFTLTNTSVNALDLQHAGGTVTLTNSGDKIVVNHDYTANFGTGNGFDRLAGVSGSGAVIAAGSADAVVPLGGQRQTIDGTGVTGGGLGQNATIAFGNKHVGDAAQTINYNINNTRGDTGPILRGAIQTVGTVDSRLSGDGVNQFSTNSLAYSNTGITHGNSLTGNAVTFTAGTTSGALSSQLNVVNNFDQTKQAINITGAAYAYANASVSGAVSVGAQHVGNNNAGVAANIAVTNNGTGATGFVENLGVSASANPNAVVVGSNTISGIAAGGSNNSLQVGVNTSTAGAITGSVNLALTSETIAGGLSNTGIGSSPTSVTGNVYDYANAVYEASSITGSGVLSSNAGTLIQRDWTLSYSNVAKNATIGALLDVKNLAAAGFADLLGGTFTKLLGGNGVTDIGGWGSSTFGNTVAGGLTGGPLAISIDTSTTGLFTQTFNLVWNGLQTNFTGGNWFGTSNGQNSTILATLTINGNVVEPSGNPEPGILWLFGSWATRTQF